MMGCSTILSLLEMRILSQYVKFSMLIPRSRDFSGSAYLETKKMKSEHNLKDKEHIIITFSDSETSRRCYCFNSNVLDNESSLFPLICPSNETKFSCEGNETDMDLCI